MSALSERLTELVGEQGWSLRQLNAKAEAAGHKLDHSTAGKYLNGTHGRPQDQTLRAFAAIVPGASITELRQLAGVSPGSGRPFEVPDGVERLTDRQKRLIEQLIVAIVNPDEAGEPGDDTAPTNVRPLRAQIAAEADEAEPAQPLSKASRKSKQIKGPPPTHTG